MSSFLTMIRETHPSKVMLLYRLLAGVPLTLFGVIHLLNPAPLRDILVVSEFPMVEVNVYLAPTLEVIAGLSMLVGFYVRIGGILGVAIMIPAIIATAKLQEMADAPHVPSILIPIVILLACLLLIWRGAGDWSVDWSQTSRM
ncbi:MAG: DoxX family protein [Gemmataceae bacterium]